MTTQSNNTVVEALPPAWYASPEVFAAEREHIFAREWTVAGPASAVNEPGQWISLRIADRPVIVIRAEDGQLHGFMNVCRHRASTLVDEASSGHCRALSCPYHGWVYGLDGTLRAAPGFDGANNFDRDNFGLFKVSVDVWNGIVFASLATPAQPLQEWLGDVVAIARNFASPESLRFHSRVDNAGNADWKVYSDNSAEGYHLEYVHRALSAAVDETTTVRPYPDGRFVGFDVGYRTQDGTPSRGFWVYKFPGVLLHFSSHGFNMERVVPTAPGKIMMQRWFWSDPAASAADAERAVAESSEVMGEDLSICERVQQNLNAGCAPRGVLSAERERGTIYFQKLVREALSGVSGLPA